MYYVKYYRGVIRVNLFIFKICIFEELKGFMWEREERKGNWVLFFFVVILKVVFVN